MEFTFYGSESHNQIYTISNGENLITAMGQLHRKHL